MLIERNFKMPKNKFKSLKPEMLRATFDFSKFKFKTTADLKKYEIVGQDRAIMAANFGINIAHNGFNIFALGPSGMGKRHTIMSLLKKVAPLRSPSKDICYIYNFKDPYEPNFLLLPPGMGKTLADDMDKLVEILKNAIPAAFESKAYKDRIKKIEKQYIDKQENAMQKIQAEAEKSDLVILRTPQGFIFAPAKDGKVLEDQEFALLPKEEREKKDQQIYLLHKQMADFLEQIPSWQKEQYEKIREAQKYFTILQVGSIIAEVKKKYEKHLEVSKYLDEVEQAILEIPEEFLKRQESVSIFKMGLDRPLFTKYKVNILVQNDELNGVPIIYEDNPSFVKLMGRMDHISQFGALVTDFTLIRAGALHRANGGFLLIDAFKLLSEPLAYEGLKRALRTKEIKVENISQALGLMSTLSLNPKPIPLDLKVILLGERRIYYLLAALDPEFLELFKVAADFNEDMERSLENDQLFAGLLADLCEREGLKHLSKKAVAEVILHASRIAQSRNKVSMHTRLLSDLLREADHLSSKKIIEDEDITNAIEQQIFRASRINEKIQENIYKGRLLIDTQKTKIGQINGLSVIELGGYFFGFPVRITAKAGCGSGQVLDIEREVKLGGPIHSKGVLILAGYLNGLFAKTKPLSLSASLVFEQSYGQIEGDSASAAEACALISAISLVPIKQSIAITGSINQHGQMQAVGGINEKIEGFFEVCKANGLKGDQGVIIPKSSFDGLSLKKSVIEAVRKKLFFIYTVESLDEALEILTDLSPGKIDKKGNFQANTVFGKTAKALKDFARKSKRS